MFAMPMYIDVALFLVSRRSHYENNYSSIEYITQYIFECRVYWYPNCQKAVISIVPKSPSVWGGGQPRRTRGTSMNFRLRQAPILFRQLLRGLMKGLTGVASLLTLVTILACPAASPSGGDGGSTAAVSVALQKDSSTVIASWSGVNGAEAYIIEVREDKVNGEVVSAQTIVHDKATQNYRESVVLPDGKYIVSVHVQKTGEKVPELLGKQAGIIATKQLGATAPGKAKITTAEWSEGKIRLAWKAPTKSGTSNSEVRYQVYYTELGSSVTRYTGKKQDLTTEQTAEISAKQKNSKQVYSILIVTRNTSTGFISTSDQKKVTVPADTEFPTIASIEAKSGEKKIVLVFSEALAAGQKLTPSSFGFSRKIQEGGKEVDKPYNVETVELDSTDATATRVTVTLGEALLPGEIKITVTADTVSDLQGNKNEEINTTKSVRDKDRPVLQTDGIQASSDKKTITLIFNEALRQKALEVKKFIIKQGEVKREVAGAVVDTDDPSVVIITLEAAPQPGDITVGLEAGAVADEGGKENEETPDGEAVKGEVKDKTPPTLTGVAASSDTKVVTLTFSEKLKTIPSTDNVKNNFRVTQGGKLNEVQTATVGTDKKQNQVTLTVTNNLSEADISITLEEGAVKDQANNGNVELLPENAVPVKVADKTPPTLRSVRAVSAARTVTLTFSEALKDIPDTDKVDENFTVTQGGKPNKVTKATVSGDQVTLTVTNDLTIGEISVTLKAGAVKDQANNGNVELLPENAGTATVTDGAKPTLLLEKPITARTDKPTTVILHFSKALEAIPDTAEARKKFTVTQGGTANTVTGATVSGDQVTLTVDKALSVGPISVTLVKGAVKDGSGNENEATPAVTGEVEDKTLPTIASTNPITAANNEPKTITLTFSEELQAIPVTEDAKKKFTVTQGTGTVTYVIETAVRKGTLGEEAKQVTLTVDKALSVGPISVRLEKGAVKDTAGNENETIPAVTGEVEDKTPPTLKDKGMGIKADSGTNKVTLVFSEPLYTKDTLKTTDFRVTQPNKDGQDVANNVGEAVITGSNVKLTVNNRLVPGEITVTVKASAVKDSAGNENVGPIAVTGKVADKTPPTLTGVAASSDTKVVTLTFSEALKTQTPPALVPGNFRVTQGGKLNEVQTATVGTDKKQNQVTLTVTNNLSEADISITLEEGAVKDQANNGNVELLPENAVPVKVADKTPPTLRSVRAVSAARTVTLTFSEALKDIPDTDKVDENFTVTQGGTANTVTGATVSGDQVILTVTSNLTIGEIAVSLAAQAVEDEAGNKNVELLPENAVTATVTDGAKPTLLLEKPITASTDKPTTVILRFSKDLKEIPKTQVAGDNFKVKQGTDTNKVENTVTGAEVDRDDKKQVTLTVDKALSVGPIWVTLVKGAVKDNTNNENENEEIEVRGEVEDRTLPTIASTNPITAANNEPKTITLTFSEELQAIPVTEDAKKKFTVTQGTGTVTYVIETAVRKGTLGEEAKQVTLTVDKALSVGPISVRLEKGAVKDTAGNENETIPAVTGEVKDTTPPTLKDKGMGIKADSETTTVTLVFTEVLSTKYPLQIGNFTVKQGSTGGTGGTENPVTGAKVSGDQVILTVTNTLTPGEITVALGPDAVSDRANNKSKATAKPVVGTVDDKTPPTLKKVAARSDKKEVTLTFSEALETTPALDTTKFIVKQGNPAEANTVTEATVSGDKVTLKVDKALSVGPIAVTLKAGAVKDKDGNEIAKTDVDVQVEDKTPPMLTRIDITAGTNKLTAVFDEAVTILDRNKFKLEVSSVTKTITNVSGTGTDTITLTLDQAVSAGTTAITITLTLKAGAVKDAKENQNTEQSQEKKLAPKAASPVPSAPTDVTATAGEGKITVTWDEPTSTGTTATGGNAAITGYTVYWKAGTTVSTSDFDDWAKVTARAYDIHKFTGGTAYTVMVVAHNINGEGAASQSATATPTTTSSATAPGKPTDVKVEDKTSEGTTGQLKVKWEYPKNYGTLSSGAPTYEIFFTVYWKKGKTVSLKDYGGKSNPAEVDKYDILNLEKGTEYAIIVVATNGAGLSMSSDVKTGTTGSTIATVTVIDTWQELQDIGKDADSLKGHYKLTKDLGSEGRPANFTPIGTATEPFTGTFDGAGHTITGLTISHEDSTSTATKRVYKDDAGLFGYIRNSTSVIRDLTLHDPSVTGKGNVGALVGNLVEGSVTGVKVTVSEATTASIKGEDDVGGVIGHGGGVVSASSEVRVEAGSSTGGLVGSYSGLVLMGYATGAVTGGKHTGGLVGLLSRGTVTGYATGAVTGTNYVGGLAGNTNRNGDSVTGFATGAVTGTSEVGGLVGLNGHDNTLRGYATSAVTGTSNVGGIVGGDRAAKDDITRGYALGYVVQRPASSIQPSKVGPAVGEKTDTAIFTTVHVGRTTAEVSQSTPGAGDHVGTLGGSATTTSSGEAPTRVIIAGPGSNDATTYYSQNKASFDKFSFGSSVGEWTMGASTHNYWPILNFPDDFPDGKPVQNPHIPSPPTNFKE